MRENHYTEESFRWQLELIKLRRHYENTPAGIDQNKYEELIKAWNIAWQQYILSKTQRLLPGSIPDKDFLIGRDTLLQSMESFLKQGKRNLFLYGIGGIGKSSIARAFMHFVKDQYETVNYLTVSDSLQNTFADDRVLMVSNMQYRQEKYGNRRRYFKKKLEIIKEQAKEEKILLIIDDYNLVADKDFGDILSIECDKIFTGRLNPQIWSDNGFFSLLTGMEIPALEDIYLEEFIHYYAWNNTKRKLNDPQLLQLLQYGKSVENHTLKIKLAAGNYGMENVTGLWEGKNLLHCFTLKKVEKEALMYLALLPTEGILRKLFQDVSQIPDGVLDTLKDYLLIHPIYREDFGEEILTIHPIIKEEIWKNMTPTINNCGAFIKAWGEYMDGSTNGVNTWNRSYEENRELEPYIFAMMRAFPKPAPWLAPAFEEIATFLWVQQYYAEAQKYALKIYKSVLEYYGEDHVLTAREALRVAAAYYNALEFDTANLWYLRGYEHFKSMKKMDAECKRQMLTLYTKLIRKARVEKEYQNAEVYFAEAEKLIGLIKKDPTANEKILEDVQVIQCYLMLSYAKYVAETREVKEAMEIYQRIEGNFGTITQDSYRMNEFREFYAELLFLQGNIKEALSIYEELLESTIAFRGEYYKDTLQRRERVADLSLALGNVTRAKIQYERVIAILMEEYPLQKEWLTKVFGKIVNC